MNNAQIPLSGETDPTRSRPLGIRAGFRNIRGEHRPPYRHLQTALAFDEALRIDGALLALWIVELAPGIKIDDQRISADDLFMAAQPAP
jgi:hypothetical protein